MKEVFEVSNEINNNYQEIFKKVCEICSELGPINLPSFSLVLTVFVLACFVGYFVVWKVTPALHTPLMSVTNAISSVIIVGAIISLGTVEERFSLVFVLSFLAIIIASINIFGGFFVTYRMLKMFKK